MAGPPGDDDERAREWAEAKATVADNAVPLAVSEEKTPPVEHTGKIRLTPQLFADKVELAENDGFERGVEHGRKLAKAEAEAAAVTENRRVREDTIEAFRSLWIIFDLGPDGEPPPTWEKAERWARAHMTPL